MRPWNHRQKHFRCHRFWMEPEYQHRVRRKCMAPWTWSHRNIFPHICTRRARCECRIIVPSSLVYRQVSIWIKTRTKVARKTICWMVWKIDGKKIPTQKVGPVNRSHSNVFFFLFSFLDLVSVIHVWPQIPMTMNRLRRVDKIRRTQKIRWTVRNCYRPSFNKSIFCMTQIRKYVAIWTIQKVSERMPFQLWKRKQARKQR